MALDEVHFQQHGSRGRMRSRRKPETLFSTIIRPAAVSDTWEPFACKMGEKEGAASSSTREDWRLNGRTFWGFLKDLQ